MREGLGVDLLDTRNLSVKAVEEPHRENAAYISDGRGTIRIVGRNLNPLAIDHDLNVAYGLRKKDGRWAIYAVALASTADAAQP
jgi:hypothetical protein